MADPGAWRGIGPALAAAGEGTALRLWGRIEAGRLVDATGAVALRGQGLAEGAVGEVEGRWVDGALEVTGQALSPARGRPHLGPVGARVPAVALRFARVAQLRAALQARGYQEVDTPLLLEAAGTDPFIEPIPARLRPTWNPAAPDGARFLHTSPELEMKRLLALGFPAIFQLCHVFRQGDLSPLHEPEFLMAEWYRVGWGAPELSAELVEVCREVGGLGPVVERTVASLCGEVASVDVLSLQEGAALSRALGGPEEPFVHAFSRLWAERVEPLLAGMGGVLVTRWPAALGMLARRDAQDPRVAQRFELVVDGVELANGFAELTDPAEQRARFQADRALRRAEGLPDAPMPERFLRALEAGLPPCAGVAVGVDRLAMVAAGAARIGEGLAWGAGEG